jgi:hypothetical protein
LDVYDWGIFNGDHENLEIIDSFDFDHSYNIVIIYKWQKDHDTQSVPAESIPAESGRVESMPAESGRVESVLGEDAELVYLVAPEKRHVLVHVQQVTF